MRTDYSILRGRCKEACEALLKVFPDLILVRGWYECPLSGDQQHWWLETPSGSIIDPTIRQFNSISGTYRKFTGTMSCSECCSEYLVNEGNQNHIRGVCSSNCYCYMVGIRT